MKALLLIALLSAPVAGQVLPSEAELARVLLPREKSPGIEISYGAGDLAGKILEIERERAMIYPGSTSRQLSIPSLSSIATLHKSSPLDPTSMLVHRWTVIEAHRFLITVNSFRWNATGSWENDTELADVHEQLEDLNRDLKMMIEMDKAILRQGKDGVSRIKILYKPKATYTDVARTKKVRGSVSLRVAFNTDGTVEILNVLKGLPNGLTESVIEAAKGVRFEPALHKGKPVRVVSMMQYMFDLY